MYVCTILIFLNINYVVIEWIIYVKLRYGINFRKKLRTGLQLVAVRSQRGPRLVADRSPTSRRPIADQSPTSFNDSHAPILLKLVGDRSATSRRLIGDWSATSPGPACDQISRSQVFVQAQKPGCDWFGRNEVPDQSPTSLQHRRDRSGTLLRPLRSVKIVSRGEVAERLQCMSDWGLTDLYSSKILDDTGHLGRQRLK